MYSTFFESSGNKFVSITEKRGNAGDFSIYRGFDLTAAQNARGRKLNLLQKLGISVLEKNWKSPCGVLSRIRKALDNGWSFPLDVLFLEIVSLNDLFHEFM